MQSTAVVVVPVYKIDLNIFEIVSIRQLFRVLSSYKIVYIVPSRLNVEPIFKYGQPDLVMKFDDRFFSNRETYSRLLMDMDFYGRFSDFEYMLIYQLDAFVFEDKMEYFCSLNFDYIGAPVPYAYWQGMFKRVGNGGFSLRKIKSIISLLKNKNEVFSIARKEKGISFCKELLKFEDQFFSYAGSKENFDFDTASLDAAYKFALECNVARQFKKIDINSLPFGCHRWYDDSFCFWEKYVVRYGYTFSELDKLKTCSDRYINNRKYAIRKYLLKRIEREDSQNIFQDWKTKIGNKKTSLWGYGVDGKRMRSVSRTIGVEISYIFDAKILEEFGLFRKATKENILKVKGSNIVVIGSTKYFEEIKKIMLSWGLKENEDFVSLIYYYDSIVNIKYPFWRKYSCQ